MADCQVTVLMTAYNAGPYLATAIDSILGQTYAGFRFLIIDDASTDNTREIARSYHDDRIELICLNPNVGQTAALNIGLHHASTRWIARMDADDYSAPTRLEEQMNTLHADKTLSCVGAFAWIFHDDPQGVERLITPPLEYADIKIAALSDLPLIHGSIVVDREALIDVGGYDERYRQAADTEMFDRLLAKYRAANIPKPLLGIRRHDNQGTNSQAIIDEGIDIMTQRLLKTDYSPEDAVTVRGVLSRLYVVRARFSVRQRRGRDLVRDLSRGFRASPKKIWWYAGIIFVYYTIPRRPRVTMRGYFTWIGQQLVRRQGSGR